MTKRKYDLGVAFGQRVAKALDGVAEAMKIAGEHGEEVIKDNIQNRQTGKMWAGDHSSRPHGHPSRAGSYDGRVASGNMVNAVGHWVSEMGKDGKARMAVGWTNPASREPYFMFQELGGFQESRPWAGVEGMFAVQDGVAETFDVMNHEIRKVLGS